VALVRLEQLYPFPHADFAEQIALYANAKSIVWAQEEPANQGAWHRIQHYLLEHLRADQVLAAAQRKSSASPAVGYLALHNQQQKEIIDAALTLDAATTKKAAV
jgi:2-oxoglutarate dehydrogenase E1 component